MRQRRHAEMHQHLSATSTSLGQRPHYRHKYNVHSILIWLFLLMMVCIELIAYKSLDIDTTTPSPKSSAVATDPRRDYKDAANNPSVPVNQPTTTTKLTYSPTPKAQGTRLKVARRESHKNSFFWTTHTPDQVPPLPPNADEQGNKSPPVIAYAVTLTKCNPKHSRSLDGAAVLMHSIRRNSYGWTSFKEQVQNSGMEGEEDFDEKKWPFYGGRGGRYRYRMYAIVDPEASPEQKSSQGDCARFLQKLGYVILHRAPLVPLFPITSEFYNMDSSHSTFFQTYKTSGYLGSHRSTTGPLARGPTEREDALRLKMHNDGCCGYTETLKLHVYGLVEHQIAVHLDLDSLLLQPMDDLFDAMLGVGNGTVLPLAKGPKTKTPDYTKSIDAAFTRDYNSVRTPTPKAQVGYQGGFLAIKPSMEVLEQYKEILKRGEFNLTDVVQQRGWGGKFGAFYGSMTFQGLVPYYYEEVAPKGLHNEIELDRCKWNQMADNPRKTTYKFPRATPLNSTEMGFRDTKVCRDGRKDCRDTDCQLVHPKDTVTTHFTFCKKPWDCSEGLPGTVADGTCKGLLREWFSIRRELEDWWILMGKSAKEVSYFSSETLSAVRKQRSLDGLKDHYLGYCRASGDPEAYFNLVQPDSPQT